MAFLPSPDFDGAGPCSRRTPEAQVCSRSASPPSHPCLVDEYAHLAASCRIVVEALCALTPQGPRRRRAYARGGGSAPFAPRLRRADFVVKPQKAGQTQPGRGPVPGPRRAPASPPRRRHLGLGTVPSRTARRSRHTEIGQGSVAARDRRGSRLAAQSGGSPCRSHLKECS